MLSTGYRWACSGSAEVVDAEDTKGRAIARLTGNGKQQLVELDIRQTYTP